MKCLGDKKFTSAKDDITRTSVIQWAEHIFFEKNNVVSLNSNSKFQSVDEISESKLQLRVMNKGFFKDDTIGSYEFDLSYLYF